VFEAQTKTKLPTTVPAPLLPVIDSQNNSEDDLPDAAGPSVGGGPGPDTAHSAMDWAAWNAHLKQTLATWITREPVTHLVVMRIVMTPLVDLMHVLLRISSHNWELEQQALYAEGHGRSFRIIEAASGRHVEAATRGLHQLFHDHPQALPMKSMTLSTRNLMFRMLARSLAGLQFLLEHSHTGFPYRLFLAMRGPEEAQKILDAEPCLRDELSSIILGRFNTVEKLCGPDCQSILECIAIMADIDIATIESRHAATRRVISARSVQTHASSLEAISAEWVLRQHGLVKRDFRARAGWKAKKGRGGEGEGGGRRRKVTRKRTVGGGAYRAFLHIKSAGGIAWTPEKMRAMAVEYRQLSATDSLYFKEIGRLAVTWFRLLRVFHVLVVFYLFLYIMIHYFTP